MLRCMRTHALSSYISLSFHTCPVLVKKYAVEIQHLMQQKSDNVWVIVIQVHIMLLSFGTKSNHPKIDS